MNLGFDPGCGLQRAAVSCAHGILVSGTRLFGSQIDLEKLGRVRWALEQGITQSVLTHSGTHNIEIMPAGIDKGSGVAELAEYFHIGLDEVMAIGDQDNDLPMIRLAGWGVAMGNATEDVKSQARLVTLSNAEDGVAYAIRHYALGQA